jgi:excinuclease ABC subunit C
MVGLAKKREEVIVSKQGSLPGADITQVIKSAKRMSALTKESQDYISILLPNTTAVVKLLQRIRDESHRFALGYHQSMRNRRLTSSSLENMPGLGPASRKALVRHFGSLRAAASAPETEVIKVLGPVRAKLALSYLSALKKTK